MAETDKQLEDIKRLMVLLLLKLGSTFLMKSPCGLRKWISVPFGE